jgi:hypothetical protein
MVDNVVISIRAPLAKIEPAFQDALANGVPWRITDLDKELLVNPFLILYLEEGDEETEAEAAETEARKARREARAAERRVQDLERRQWSATRPDR